MGIAIGIHAGADDSTDKNIAPNRTVWRGRNVAAGLIGKRLMYRELIGPKDTRLMPQAW